MVINTIKAKRKREVNMKKEDDFIEMVCPVCGKYFFADLTELEKSLGEERCEDICDYCGWHYDIEQFKDPTLQNKSNEKSLNEYRELYKEKIKVNPNYEYYEEIMPPDMPHLCPVCGKYEFPDEASFDICPDCGWEDDALQLDEPDYGVPHFPQSSPLGEGLNSTW